MTLLTSYACEKALVRIYESPEALGAAAAMQAADIIRSTVARAGRARIMIATGNSQLHLIGALAQQEKIDWGAIDIFHMDEYIGISGDHPSSFRYWIRTRVHEKVHPASVEYIAGDARDIDAEIARYSRLISAGPIHLAFVGFGENGHIAFNDPTVADFEDPLAVKRVALEEGCRRQQVGEGHFRDIESVPREAITVTCPALFRAEAWVCSVPEARKAEAVRRSLDGPISTACPASLVRMHPNATIYLDTDSAALLTDFVLDRAK